MNDKSRVPVVGRAPGHVPEFSEPKKPFRDNKSTVALTKTINYRSEDWNVKPLPRIGLDRIPRRG